MNGPGAGARRGGRHRRGLPAVQVRPAEWDVADRASAEQLDRLEPTWAVWYGVGTRRFYAVAAWPASGPLLVCARTAAGLRDLMRQAEQTSASNALNARPALRRSEQTPLGAPMPETPDGAQTVCWQLPHDLSVVGKARALVSETLAAWELPELADDVVLVAGELLANAIGYGEPVVGLALRTGDGELRVEVGDRGLDLPRRLDLGIEAVHGRGLAIVEALADDFGVTLFPDRPGKTVWARWHLPR
ncbi:ATP-binding protein [Streptosporangium sp. NBC_01756]|uniref:ATP-binding protein n=1 Tax=Streptosporangium sp. NBC_01756 TaxID=2975950 RepID=UPI002DDAF051|nr:ATP-binding protein [Streptosporangium sp. NBC_01756]WSC88933.1 ATP-binding protein [Streptosporangium sp. NBC_01756]